MMTVPQLKKAIMALCDDKTKIDPEYGIKKKNSHDPFTWAETKTITIYFMQDEITDACIAIRNLCRENGYIFSPYFKTEVMGYMYFSGWDKGK